MATYNVHGGHAAVNKKYCGAVGLLNESKEDRLIKDEIIRLLRLNGHTVYDCTVDSGSSQTDVLKQICAKCNAHDVDMDFSIHLNSGRNDYKGDGKLGGFEIWLTNTNSGKGDAAARIRAKMKALGFADRGTKTASNLYYLNHTKAPALLLEICFVDDKDDWTLYNLIGYKKIAEEIVKGILNKSTIATSGAQWLRDNTGWWYRYPDGSWPAAKWDKIDGIWYWFNSSGYAVTGWQKIGGEWYYFNSDCKMQTGWIKDKDKWYWLKNSGAMACNETLNIGGKQYKFDSSGAML